jgi:hypothetical protein
MKKWLAACALTCAPALVMAQSLECDGKIISRGTTLAEVAAACGEAAQVDHKSVYNGAGISTGGQPSALVGSTVEVQIEVWTYNFGPNKLMQRIRFQDGVVVRIESLGFGY